MATESDREQHDHFPRLFMEHEESLRVFVRSLLFTRDEAREVMQEVAAPLWRRFDPDTDSLSLCRRAFGVARREVPAFRQDRARDRHSYGVECFELLAQTIWDQSDCQEEERRALDPCLQKLPAVHGQLMQAAYAPGGKIEKLARQLRWFPQPRHPSRRGPGGRCRPNDAA